MSSPEQVGPSESPIIHLTHDPELVEKLRLKRDEYYRRFSNLGPYKSRDQILVETVAAGHEIGLDATLKARLLDELLDGEIGEVITWDFVHRIVKEPEFERVIKIDGHMFGESFLNACAVIDAYCSGDMIVVIGGTDQG